MHIQSAGATASSVSVLLERVDWNFPGATTLDQSLHSIHWFPGNFIPEIPSFLVQILSRPGDVVLDPFCGSGTTGVEALRLGRKVILSDINQASIQVTEGKLAAMAIGDNLGQLFRMAQDLIWDALLRTDLPGRNGEGTDPNLQYWLESDTLAQLRFLWRQVESVEDAATRQVLEVLFSDTLFACASTAGSTTSGGKRRRHHWGWIADNVRPKVPVRHNAIVLFRERLLRLMDIINSLSSPLKVEASVNRFDARCLELEEHSVDLIVTSPPYLGMIDYTLANRLSYLWFGWPMDRDKAREIGARYRRRNSNIVKEYLADMAVVFRRMSLCLKPGGYCALVIGASRRFGDLIKEIIEVAAGSELQVIWGPTLRIPSRRRISDRLGTSSKEYVCVLRRAP